MHVNLVQAYTFDHFFFFWLIIFLISTFRVILPKNIFHSYILFLFASCSLNRYVVSIFCIAFLHFGGLTFHFCIKIKWKLWNIIILNAPLTQVEAAKQKLRLSELSNSHRVWICAQLMEILIGSPPTTGLRRNWQNVQSLRSFFFFLLKWQAVSYFYLLLPLSISWTVLAALAEFAFSWHENVSSHTKWNLSSCCH